MSLGYISGVYNYCDRWCERCPLTARCRLFAFDQALQRTDDGNAAFWQVFDDIARREPPDWPDELPDDEPDDESLLPELHQWDDAEDEDDFDIVPGHDGRNRDPLVQAASEYGRSVHEWLKQHTELSQPHVEQPRQAPASPDDVRYVDALDVLAWYSLLIGIKLARSLAGARDYEEETRWDSDHEDSETALPDGVDELRDALRDVHQMERDGSAKVALIGIERSLGAWTILRDHLPQHERAIRQYQQALARLRHAIDERIPGARTFQRPGFEYEV